MGLSALFDLGSRTVRVARFTYQEPARTPGICRFQGLYIVTCELFIGYQQPRDYSSHGHFGCC